MHTDASPCTPETQGEVTLRAMQNGKRQLGKCPTTAGAAASTVADSAPSGIMIRMRIYDTMSDAFMPAPACGSQ